MNWEYARVIYKLELRKYGDHKTSMIEILEPYGAVIRAPLICGAAIGLGIVLGNGAVYFFNRIPGKWLTDYDAEPSEELLRPTRQRVRSTPWKYVFTGFFICCGIYLGLRDPAYAFPALAAMWLLLEMSIADLKYMIVPDQLVLLLGVTSLGFITRHRGGPLDAVWGALLGFGVLASMALLAKLMYKKPAIGGADVKLFGVLGLATGVDGILFIFIASTFLSAGHFIWLMLRKKARLTDERAMVPYIAAAAAFYLVFLHDLLYNSDMWFPIFRF